MKTIHVDLSGDMEEAAAIAVDFLMNGGSVVMPMDTSYGLAADATNLAAVQGVFDLKGRGPQTSSVVVADRAEAETLGSFDESAEQLWDALMPGPLTLILPVRPNHGMCDLVVSPLGIGIRHPKFGFTQLVAERFGRPYTATSANRTGEPSASSVEEFLRCLPDDQSPHLVIDAGELPIAESSTVVSVAGGVTIQREGAIDASVINRITGAA